MLRKVRVLVFALVLAVSSAAPAVCEIVCGLSAGHVHHHDAETGDDSELSTGALVSVAETGDHDCAHPPVAPAIVDSLRSTHVASVLVEVPSAVAVARTPVALSHAALPLVWVSPHSSPPLVPLRI